LRVDRLPAHTTTAEDGLMNDETADDVMARIDPTRPHSARVWNYWVGGKDNYEVDRETGEQVKAVFPGIVEIARHSRAFLVRAVRHLAGDAGIRQFLDVGTGLPTAGNTHEVAQAVPPACRVVYVDNDPIVLAHARALLSSTREGRTTYVDADVRDPDRILAEAAQTLDFSRPVAVMLLGILGNVEDYDEARTLARRLLADTAPGSYLVVNDGTHAIDPATLDAAAEVRAEAGDPYYLRTVPEMEGFFEGLDLITPGVVSTPLWRPDPDAIGTPRPADVFCGVARKP
jgi:O-methyltransferase involved in polyketide biosynthesis